MKKEDIKSGMVVKLRNGTWCLALTHEGILKFVSKEWIECNIDDYNDSLECQSNNKLFDASVFDIVEVGIAQCPKQLLLDDKSFNIIWERDEVKEMTIEEIEKELGYKIKIVE